MTGLNFGRRARGNAAPAWPFTLPSVGAIGSISTNVLTDVTDDANEDFSLSKVLSSWGTAALTLEYVGATVVDFVYYFFGGGHGDTANDAVYGYRGSTGEFFRTLAPSASAVSLMAIPGTNATTDTTHGEDIAGRPDSQHPYSALHGLHSNENGGPGFMQVYGQAIGSGAIKSGQAHRFDGTAWERFADVGPVSTTDVDCVIKDETRGIFLRFPCDGSTAFHTLDYTDDLAEWQTSAQTARDGDWSATYMAAGIHDPVRDIYIAGFKRTGAQIKILDATDPTGAWQDITTSGTAPPDFWGVTPMHNTTDDTFLFVVTTDLTPPTIYILTPPVGDPFAGTWVWTSREFTGTSSFASEAASGTEYFGRFQYVEALHSIIVCPSGTAQMECWRL